MKRTTKDFLKDILDAITSIDKFIENFNFEQLILKITVFFSKIELNLFNVRY